MKPLINAIGWYGHKNIGDESYKLAFPEVFPNYNFVFSDKAIPDQQSYILGGGDVVSEDFLKTIKNYKNKHIISATISKKTNLSDFENVFVRDNWSLSNCLNKRAILMPDIAFGLTPNINDGQKMITELFKSVGHDHYRKVFIVVINSYLMSDYVGNNRDFLAFQNFSNHFGKFMDNTDASFLFLPFGRGMPHDDRISNAWVSSKCKWWKKNVVVYDVLSVQETLNIISASDLVISSRLHSTIFSCLCSVPFIDITHGHKNRIFLETANLSHYSLPYEEINHVNLGVKSKSVVGNFTVKEELNKVTALQKGLLSEFSKNIHFI